MANRIGKYRRFVIRMAYTAVRDTSYGDGRPTYVDGPGFWAEVVELSAQQQSAYSQKDSRADVEIRARGVIELSQNDRVRVKATGIVYQLDGVRIRDDGTETICSGYRHTATGMPSME